MAPAPATGNAVVLKPASLTPVTGGTLFAKIYEEAGLPPGVLSVVAGAGDEIGETIVTDRVPRLEDPTACGAACVPGVVPPPCPRV